MFTNANLPWEFPYLESPESIDSTDLMQLCNVALRSSVQNNPGIKSSHTAPQAWWPEKH